MQIIISKLVHVMFAVFEVTNVIGLERIVSGIARLGYMDVTCKPLFQYEKFASYLGVNDETLLKLNPEVLANDKQVYWLDFTVEYPGKLNEDIILNATIVRFVSYFFILCIQKLINNCL